MVPKHDDSREFELNQKKKSNLDHIKREDQMVVSKHRQEDIVVPEKVVDSEPKQDSVVGPKEIPTQTDMGTGLPHKVWKSKMSFTNQVYLDHSKSNLKSYKSTGVGVQAKMSQERPASDKKLSDVRAPSLEPSDVVKSAISERKS